MPCRGTGLRRRIIHARCRSSSARIVAPATKRSKTQLAIGQSTYRGAEVACLDYQEAGAFPGGLFVANPQRLEDRRRFALYDRTHRPDLDRATVRLQDFDEVVHWMHEAFLGYRIKTDFCFYTNHESVRAWRVPLNRGLLGSKRLDGLQPGRACRGIQAEEQTKQGREKERAEGRRPGNRCRPIGQC